MTRDTRDGQNAAHPSGDTPLSEEELDLAFRDRSIMEFSGLRQAAAVLDACGRTMSLDDVEARLETLTPHRGPLSVEQALSWRRDSVRVESDAGVVRLTINRESKELPSMRRAVRALADKARVEAERQRASAASSEEASRRWAARQAAEREEAARLRRAILVAGPRADRPDAVAVVDVKARTVRTLAGSDLGRLKLLLAEYDLVAGLDPGATLAALGLAIDRVRLVDLRPKQKTRMVRGHQVPVTFEKVLRATTGKSWPFGRTTRGESADAVNTKRFMARLEEAAGLLLDFYEFGILHGAVRFAGTRDVVTIPADWAEPGDHHLGETLDDAVRSWTTVDLVLGRPADWQAPWRDARRVRILEWRAWQGELWVKEDDRCFQVEPLDIHGARVADASDSRRFDPSKFDGCECRLRILLEGADRPIWRRFTVPATLTLAGLHDVIQVVMGWTNSHLHYFEVGRERIGIPYQHGEDFFEDFLTRSSHIVRLSEVIAHGHKRFRYLYDMGDGWSHLIQVEEVSERGAGGTIRCLDGERACPPEDCGGIEGYAHLLHVLRSGRRSEEADELRAWVGPDFQPERFDRRRVNEDLARLHVW
jgi:hypothetical protein